MNSDVIINKNKNIIRLLGAVLISICITLVMILAFAFIIKFTNLSDKFIFPINQVIKVISIFIGVIFFLKKSKEKGFLKGILIGLLYYIISFVTFSILQGNFSVTLNNLYDLLITTFMGGIIGIIVINAIK